MAASGTMLLAGPSTTSRCGEQRRKSYAVFCQSLQWEAAIQRSSSDGKQGTSNVL